MKIQISNYVLNVIINALHVTKHQKIVLFVKNLEILMIYVTAKMDIMKIKLQKNV